MVLRDMHQLTSMGIKWLEHYADDLKTNGSVLMLTDVNAPMYEILKRSGALDVIGAEHVFLATTRVLAAENTAWEAAQRWVEAHAATKA